MLCAAGRLGRIRERQRQAPAPVIRTGGNRGARAGEVSSNSPKPTRVRRPSGAEQRVWRVTFGSPWTTAHIA